MPCPSQGYVALGTPGQVLQNVSIVDCDINVTAANVQIRNVKLLITAPNTWGIIVRDGASAAISDVEISGRDKSTGSVQYAILAQSGATVMITRADLHHCADCVQGEHVILQDSWVHDLANPPGAHVDGFQCNGNCSGTVIRHNRIHVEYNQTGAVALFQDFGVPNNVLVENNWLSGAGYTIYGGAGTQGTPTNIRILNNVVDPGEHGWLAYWDPTGSGNVATGNRTSTGVPLVP